MNASLAASNVTIIQPKPDSLHEAVDMLHTSQITGDYRYAALALAGPLMTEVGRVFPLPMILIYLTTSYKRRQVCNAYIAAMFADPANPRPIVDPCAVRYKLMHASSKKLLIEAYGSVPDGLVRVLGLLGLEGQQPLVYVQLHEQMSKSATLRKVYSHAASVESSTVSALAALPESLKSVELAQQFRKSEDLKNLSLQLIC